MATQPNAAFVVLTDQGLLEHITGFQRGLPYLLGEFDASLVTPDGSRIGNYTGKLPTFAIRQRNQYLLELLLRATQIEHLRALPQLQFCGVYRCAIEYNSLQLLKWLHATRDKSPTLSNSSRLLPSAVTSYFDNVEILQWLHSAPEGPREPIADVSVYDVCCAAELGNNQAIRWLHAHRSMAFSPHVIDTAATHGHLELVQFLDQNRSEGCTVKAMHGAALNGYHEVVQYLAQNRTEGPDVDTLEMTASAGHLRCVQVLLQYAKPASRGRLENAHQRAVDEGHTDVAQFLLSQLQNGATTEGTGEQMKTKRCFTFGIFE